VTVEAAAESEPARIALAFDPGTAACIMCEDKYAAWRLASSFV